MGEKGRCLHPPVRIRPALRRPSPAAGRRTLQVSAGLGGGGSRDCWAEGSSRPPPRGVLPSARQPDPPTHMPTGLQGPRSSGGWSVSPPPPHPKSPAPWRASACSYGLVSSGLGALGPSGALHWRSSAHMGSPESPEGPEVTEPSRLVRESSGGEVRKPQLDTRVRQDPPRGTVSGAGW